MAFRDDSLSDALIVAANQNRVERDYWLNKLSGELEGVHFPPDFKVRRDGKESLLSVELPEALSSRALTVGKHSDHALNVVLAAGLVVLLHKYTGNRDILVGTAIYRQETGKEFINTVLVLRNQLEKTMTFKDALLMVKQTITEADRHQNYPFEILQKQLTPPGFPGSSREFLLFDTAILLENIHERDYFPIRAGMVFVFRRDGSQIRCKVEYDLSMYRESTVKQITGHFVSLLNEALFNLDLEIAEIDILSEEEKKQLLKDFNDTGTQYPTNKTIPQLFAHQAEKTPDKISIVGKERATETTVQLTYRELNQKADQAAHFLREKNVGPDTIPIVAIMAEHSIEMIIGILGILKAGGAYLPIDPEYPEERIQYMLKDSNVRVLLSEVSEWSKVSEGTEMIDLPSLIAEKGDAKPTHLCYIIYTSGTTGTPKGAAIEHRSAVNTLLYRKAEYRMGPDVVSLQLFSFGFDGFVTSFFTPIISGAAVVLLEREETGDIGKIREAIKRHHVTHFIIVPSLYSALVESLSAEDISSLNTVTLAGEQVKQNVLENTTARSNTLEIVNEYGVTESSVLSTIYRHQERDDVVKIGHPTANTRVYILDEAQHLQPIGVAGEMCIGGDGLARGYLNQPELTAERFISLSYRSYRSYRSYKTYISKKIYKTGDLARWLADGNIEFLGRMDHQVKIRGFRLELGEIENRLLKHPGVKETAVISRENETGDKYLCAYFTAQAGHSEPPITIIEDLRVFLSRTLPHYMIPSHFRQIEKIPLTPNGKVDRKVLPVPEISVDRTYTPPSNETEEQLTIMWRDMLGLGKDVLPGAPGIDDNFFLLGGHSIKITVMALRIEKTLNVTIPVLEIYKRPTIRELAAYIGAVRNDVRLPRDEKLVLLWKVPKGAGEMETPHLFFIHDGTGEVDGYVEFCRHLHLDTPLNCWGIRFQTGQLQEIKHGGLNIQQLARQYIETIKKVQPHGPYYISGWSLGGVIVFEMVRQLEKSGETVGFTALIDSPAPNTYLSKLALEHFSDEEIDRQTGRMGNVDIVRALHDARFSYVPESKIKTPVHYFESSRSKEIDKMYKRMNIKQWKKLTRGKMTFHEIPGDHFSIFRGPQVEGFVKVFQRALQSPV